ncbi:DUF1738 domain-containing protein [Pedobacter panaciterrae]|uniref:ArdC family protein n=1 Tax=Pedobacter panaciterrae TaxID=363849 RepID=UPI00155DC14C|nr:zincin-like metallopeptidase domain-containing protein [Pedobacter panaciterrae]NQX54480.1 DUF1738 domain-containing protein [Pedobacter panaciterrae]
MTNFKPLHEQIAEKLIAELKAGTSPFQKAWIDDNNPGFSIPLNPTTGKNYRGLNALWLGMQPFSDPRWLTLRQANINKWQVQKGAKATLINFVQHTDKKAVLDENGKAIRDENGKVRYTETQLEKPIITNAWVFNAEQISGIPELALVNAEKLAAQKWSPIERAEAILNATNPSFKHGGNYAFYNYVTDQITLPHRHQFPSATEYYATALHELGHWTGHKSRLDRDMMNGFGTPDYAREELRAEIASLMVGSEIGTGHYFEQHAVYVEDWIKVLQDDPFELQKAAADAQKIYDFILDIELKLNLKQEVERKPESKFLMKGDEIVHNDTTYKVTEVLKGKQVKIEDIDSGEQLKLSHSDGLYKSLLVAKNYPMLNPEVKMDNTRELILNNESSETAMKRKR